MEMEKPDLYRPAPDGARLRLIASRCAACDGLSFPRAVYGCRQCGAVLDQSREEELSGEATLLSFVTVYQKLAPDLEPPFVVGEAEIADGLVEEIMIDAPEETLAVGMPLVAVPRTVSRGGRDVVACRFVPADAAR